MVPTSVLLGALHQRQKAAQVYVSRSFQFLASGNSHEVRFLYWVCQVGDIEAKNFLCVLQTFSAFLAETLCRGPVCKLKANNFVLILSSVYPNGP